MAFSESLSVFLNQIKIAVSEAEMLMGQHKEMLESNISDLNQRRDVEKMDKLKKETARLRLAVRKSRDAEKRRSDLEKQRKQVKSS